jgi:hypothetical protein
MKNAKQINAARVRLRERVRTPGLTNEQIALIMGMLNAIVWVADGEHSITMERVLSDEPMAVGKSADVPLAKFKEGIAKL